MTKKKRIKNASGLSLIELLVAVFIFVLIIMVATETFTSTFSSWTKTRRTQANLENARTALETIGKSIRMSNQLEYSSSTGVLSMFNHSRNKCIRYRSGALGSLESSICEIKEPNPPTDPFTYDCSKDSCDGGNAYGSWGVLINSDFKLYFNIIKTKKDSDANNNVIGKATVSALVGSSALAHEQIQTTVSFRDYKDFFYVTAP